MNLLSKHYRWLNYSLFYLLLSAVLGVFMRVQVVMPLGGFNYQYLVHTHSHIALLGWAFSAAFLCLIYTFLSESQIAQKKYQVYFWWIQISVIGMFFSFPIQGYAFWSITFSTLFLLMSYWFTVSFLKDLKRTKRIGVDIKFIRAGMFYLVLSSMGPWALGPIMVMGLAKSTLYYNGVYFYLHFLYNGFFIFILVGLLLFHLKRTISGLDEKIAQSLYKWMQISLVLGFFLSTLWAKPNNLFYVLAFVGAVGQVFALYYFFRYLAPYFKMKNQKAETIIKNILVLVIFTFICKVLLQFASAFPNMAELIYEYKSTVVIGYLHLVLIGIITLGFLLYFLHQSWINPRSRGVSWGLVVFIIGWLLSEILLFGQAGSLMIGAGSLPHYYTMLFYMSCLMLVGILVLWLSQRIKRLIGHV